MSKQVIAGVAGAGLAAMGMAGAFRVTQAQSSKQKNMAFVFIKPHAVTDSTKSLVKDELKKAGLYITGEGTLTSEVIDQKKLIDQHYYAIASKATILKPSELNVPKEKFKEKFGVDFDEALSQGIVMNAMDAVKELQCTSEELNSGWMAAKKADKLVKFGGGFYCGLVALPGKKPLYVFNGFFMSMRSAFTAPGKAIHYYTVEWDEDKMSWESFRGELLGPTDPKDAPKDSLRGKIYSDWEKLGLAAVPNVGDNGVHASASPFEGLCERMNWLGQQCRSDNYCRSLVAAGVKEATIKEWSVDPQVKIEGGKKKSIFDSLEDMNATPCLEKMVSLQSLQSE